MSSNWLDSESNYYELYYSPLNSKDSNDEFPISIDSDVFYKIMRFFKHLKYYQNDYKQFTIGDITCQKYTNDQIKIYKQNFNFMYRRNQFVVIGSNKIKLSLLQYPSTNNIMDKEYIKKLIFRVTNRIFVNFEISLNEGKEKVYMIYINYNHESKVDDSTVVEQVDKLIQSMVSIS
jgi:hypothetical protein